MYIARNGKRRVLAGTEVAGEAADLLFGAEDVAELVAEVTGETVEVSSEGESAVFKVGKEEFEVTAEGDLEELLATTRSRGRRVTSGRTILKDEIENYGGRARKTRTGDYVDSDVADDIKKNYGLEVIRIEEVPDDTVYVLEDGTKVTYSGGRIYDYEGVVSSTSTRSRRIAASSVPKEFRTYERGEVLDADGTPVKSEEGFWIDKEIAEDIKRNYGRRVTKMGETRDATLFQLDDGTYVEYANGRIYDYDEDAVNATSRVTKKCKVAAATHFEDPMYTLLTDYLDFDPGMGHTLDEDDIWYEVGDGGDEGEDAIRFYKGDKDLVEIPVSQYYTVGKDGMYDGGLKGITNREAFAKRCFDKALRAAAIDSSSSIRGRRVTSSTKARTRSVRK